MLVKSLEEMAERNGWILEIPKMELMTKEEQFALAGRTTVMLGVHGSEFDRSKERDRRRRNEERASLSKELS